MSSPDPNLPEPAPALELKDYLAENDAFCSHCSYNMRGLTKFRCPECGLRPTLAGFDEFDQWVAARVTLYLRDHDLICTRCALNLRSSASTVCRNCGTLNAIRSHDPGSWISTREKIFSIAIVLIVPLILLVCVAAVIWRQG